MGTLWHSAVMGGNAQLFPDYFGISCSYSAKSKFKVIIPVLALSQCVGRVINGICDCSYGFVLVCTLKGKWFELSTPNLVHIYSLWQDLGMP